MPIADYPGNLPAATGFLPYMNEFVRAAGLRGQQLENKKVA